MELVLNFAAAVLIWVAFLAVLMLGYARVLFIDWPRALILFTICAYVTWRIFA